MKKYNIIYCDPPWKFNNKKTGGSMKSGATSKYKTMTVDQMLEIDVPSITAEDCVLFMWWVGSMPLEAIKLAEGWGFKLKTMTGFNWVKTTESKERNKLLDFAILACSRFLAKSKYSEIVFQALEAFKQKLFFGMGFWTRAGSECCLIAVKGKIKPISKSVRSVVISPIGEHSEKPYTIAHQIVKLCGDLPRLEMFARDKKEGWDLFGNEVESSISIPNVKKR